MNTTGLKSVAAIAAASAVLLLSLSGCGERPGAEKERGADQATPPPTASRDRPTEGTQPKTADADAAQKAREAGKVVDDAQLTVKVKSALGAEPDLKSAAINVDSAGGVITLKGTIDSQDKRSKAEKVAENVEGVRSVRNEMVVVKG